MNDVISAVMGLLLRVVWVILGLIVLCSFILAAILAALALGLRYVWARLTGKPVQPFIFTSFTQGQGMPWGQFKSRTDEWTAKAAGQFGAKKQANPKDTLPVADVTDVESRPSKSSGSA